MAAVRTTRRHTAGVSGRAMRSIAAAPHTAAGTTTGLGTLP